MNDQSRDIEIVKRIDAYLKGKLSAREGEELWVELINNPEYLQFLETEIALKTILREKQRTSKSEKTSVFILSRSWKWIATAATITILVVSINYFGMETQQSMRDHALGSISLTDNLAAPMVFRSQKPGLSAADSMLNIGFEAALSGNLAKAVEIYESVIKKFDNNTAAAKAHLNIGIIKYNSGNFTTAAAAFDSALANVADDVLLKEKAYWYLGNAHINLDNFEDAKRAIDSAYAMGGIYLEPASRLLKKLEEELGQNGTDPNSN